MITRKRRFDQTFIGVEATVLDAIKIIDDAALQIALVIDKERRLLGTVTDGDVRRGILAGIKMDDSVTKIMNKNPITVGQQTTAEEMLHIMAARKIHQMPVLDDQKRVIDIKQIEVLVEQTVPETSGQDDVWIVLMLGGQGKRLHPLTENLPKPMLPIGDRPLLETIVRNFTAQGFRHFFFSVNYKAEIIRDHFGDGEKFNANIIYMPEKIQLGTAGALSLLPARPSGPVIVMNGDILTNCNFSQLIEFHRHTKAPATMCVREYQYQVPYGIVQTSGSKLDSIVEKPSHSYFVNAGIYIINPETLDMVPEDKHYDMPQLFEDLNRRGQDSAVFPIREYWLDIGRFEDLEQARRDYNKVFGS
jgi:dTDP-glucose pyrophosphorylase/CBS domain-containing protein